MKILSHTQVLRLHEHLIAATGGAHGLRDEGLLASALAAPFQSFAGRDVYPSVPQKAARLGYGLIKNHPFTDGNKRSGAHVMLLFLAINGIELSYTQQELIDIILSVADNRKNCDDLFTWLIQHER